jgi:LuxR family maltose regulon positive regulatory protein
MRGADIRSAAEHLERAVSLTSVDAASYWHAHAVLHLAAARQRLGDADGAANALARARAELDELPDVGVLGDLFHETEDAIRRPSRREGFLGEELSVAENRVLARLLDGLSVTEVAHELWLSPNTVKTHRRGIYRKLGVTNRDELLVRARELDIGAQPARDVHPG